MKHVARFFAIAGLVGLAGCAALGADPLAVDSGHDRTLVTFTAPIALDTESTIHGTLTVTDSGCVALASDGTSRVAVFPPGTVLTGDAIAIPELGKYLFGEDLSLRGAFEDAENYRDRLPANCDSDEVVVVV